MTDKTDGEQSEIQGELVIRTIAMPSDTNPAGDIFGGWLMGQMDLAAGNLAAKIAGGRCSTVAVDGMQFVRPVRVGDEVSIYADLIKTGRSSMSIQIQALRRRRDQSHSETVTQARFVFVALDEQGNARAL
ncbi:acyl-CoA thioesterase [Cognatishimia sp. WU-CL00825]|uniref:acyl-CoA thioesterase n=1 Tax=Cognatishimia sp. WU-CL00825 TaxID=3127658 RepID=UPI0031024963